MVSFSNICYTVSDIKIWHQINICRTISVWYFLHQIWQISANQYLLTDTHNRSEQIQYLLYRIGFGKKNYYRYRICKFQKPHIGWSLLTRHGKNLTIIRRHGNKIMNTEVHRVRPKEPRACLKGPRMNLMEVEIRRNTPGSQPIKTSGNHSRVGPITK